MKRALLFEPGSQLPACRRRASFDLQSSLPHKRTGRAACKSKTSTLCTTNVQLLEILLSILLVLVFNLFGSFGFWSFEFVSDLVAATPRCALRVSAHKI